MNFNLTEKQKMLRAAVKEFNDREIEPEAARIDREGRLPDDLIQKMARLGLLGMTVPIRYGGSAAGHVSCILAAEQISYSGAGAEWLLAFNNSIPWCLARFGSADIKRKYLPPLCDGTAYASIQFTEEDTGSDPRALKTRAVRQPDHYLITGAKRFSTFGARDGYAVLYAKDEDGACTAFVVQKNVQGYHVDKTWRLMGSGGMEAADIRLEGLKVPRRDVLGEEGKGFNILLDWIAMEKVQQCAANVGLAQAATDEAVKYARARVSGGKPISDMQGIRWMLADMECQLAAARWLTYRAAFLLDNEKSVAVEAAAAKLFVVPATIGVVESARRIHGAYGYTQELKIERLSRAILGATGIATTLELNRSIVGASLVR